MKSTLTQNNRARMLRTVSPQTQINYLKLLSQTIKNISSNKKIDFIKLSLVVFTFAIIIVLIQCV